MSAINCHVWLFEYFLLIFIVRFAIVLLHILGYLDKILYFFNFRDNLSLIYDLFLVIFVFFCVIIYCILGNFYHFLADIIVYFWENLSGIYATQIPYRTQVVGSGGTNKASFSRFATSISFPYGRLRHIWTNTNIHIYTYREYRAKYPLL